MAETVFDRDKRIRNAQLTMGQTFYLTTLNQFVGKNADAWPSQAAIAWAMNATPRAVRNWQTELEAMTVIQVDIGAGRYTTNRYRLNLDALALKEEPRSAFNREPRSALNDNSEIQCGTQFLSNRELSSASIGNSVPTERTGKEQLKEQGVSFPEKLRTPEFSEAWQSWIQFRREIKKKLTPSTITKQLTKLDAWGSAKAVRSIDASIGNGWQGLFDPDSKNGKAIPAASSDAETSLANVIAGLRKHDYETDRKGLREFIGETAWTVATKVGWQRICNRDRFTEKQIREAFIAAWGAQS